MTIVLVELPDGAGVVKRGDGEIVVTRDVRTESGQPLREGDRYLPITTGLKGGGTLVGGLVPPGATSVEVVDDRGARIRAVIGVGTYAAAVDELDMFHRPIVCCRDENGVVVRLPHPEEYVRERVADAEEFCPACGALDFEWCVPTETWRGGRLRPDGSTEPHLIILCRVCGHEESAGSIMRISSPQDDAGRARLAARRAERRRQRWHENAALLRSITFPLYAAEGWPAQINGSSSHGAEITGVTIAHTETEGADLLTQRPRIEVTTSTETAQPRELEVARQALQRLVHEQMTGERSLGLSDAAITLYFKALARRERAAVLAAEQSTAYIAIDGTAQRFLILTAAGERWVAVGRRHDITVTVAGRGMTARTFVLEPVGDPTTRLLGPEPQAS